MEYNNDNSITGENNYEKNRWYFNSINIHNCFYPSAWSFFKFAFFHKNPLIKPGNEKATIGYLEEGGNDVYNFLATPEDRKIG